MILVSACLLGHLTKYTGGSNATPTLMKYIPRSQFIAFCPEQLGGLPTPRPGSEIIGGSGETVLTGHSKVINEKGQDVTVFFIRGAYKSAQIAASHHITAAITKQRSPSCGSRQIYDGSFSHRVKPGVGVAAALLQRFGIPIYSEEDLTPEFLERLLALDLANSS